MPQVEDNFIVLPRSFEMKCLLLLVLLIGLNVKAYFHSSQWCKRNFLKYRSLANFKHSMTVETESTVTEKLDEAYPASVESSSIVSNTTTVSLQDIENVSSSSKRVFREGELLQFIKCRYCHASYLYPSYTYQPGTTARCSCCLSTFRLGSTHIVFNESREAFTPITETMVYDLRELRASPGYELSTFRRPRITLFVGGLPLSYTDKEFADLFAEYGLMSANVVKDRMTGVSKGFGFVEVSNSFFIAIHCLWSQLVSQTEADRAIQEMQGFFVSETNRLGVKPVSCLQCIQFCALLLVEV